MTITEEIAAVAAKAAELAAVPLSQRDAAYDRRRLRLMRRKAQLQKRIEQWWE